MDEQGQKKSHFLTIAEAAEFLKVSKTSLRRWSRDGRLKCYRVGRRGERRFCEDDLLSFVHGSASPVAPLPETLSTTGAEVRSWQPVQIRSPAHVCIMFRDEDDQWRQLRSYLLAHLVPGTQTVYIYHGEPQKVLDRLQGEGLDGQALIEQGILLLAPCSQTYLREGYFDFERVLGDILKVIERSSPAGTQRILLTGEMNWCASGFPGCGRVIHYEIAIDKLLRDYPWVTVVCQYPLAEIPAAVIYDSLCVHHYVQTPNGPVTGLGAR
jgi:excisionase family DNA binding protein